MPTKPSAYRTSNLIAVGKKIICFRYIITFETYNFATLITCEAGIPNASHIPFLYDAKQGDRGTLISHMAKANSQWQSFNPETEVLVIF